MLVFPNSIRVKRTKGKSKLNFVSLHGIRDEAYTVLSNAWKLSTGQHDAELDAELKAFSELHSPSELTTVAGDPSLVKVLTVSTDVPVPEKKGAAWPELVHWMSFGRTSKQKLNGKHGSHGPEDELSKAQVSDQPKALKSTSFNNNARPRSSHQSSEDGYASQGRAKVKVREVKSDSSHSLQSVDSLDSNDSAIIVAVLAGSDPESGASADSDEAIRPSSAKVSRSKSTDNTSLANHNNHHHHHRRQPFTSTTSSSPGNSPPIVAKSSPGPADPPRLPTSPPPSSYSSTPSPSPSEPGNHPPLTPSPTPALNTPLQKTASMSSSHRSQGAASSSAAAAKGGKKGASFSLFRFLLFSLRNIPEPDEQEEMPVIPEFDKPIPGGKFSPTRLADAARVCQANMTQIDGDWHVEGRTFVAVILEIARVFDMMGRSFSFIKYDITSKTDKLSELFEENQDKFTTIQGMIRWEIDHKCNGYRSGTWCTVRLRWLLEFLKVFLSALIADDGDRYTSKEAASIAYAQALARHHPWPIRKMVQGALKLIPSKSWFLNKMGLEFDSVARDVRVFELAIEPVFESIEDFHAKHRCK